MSQFPASIAPLLSSIAPNPATSSSSSNNTSSASSSPVVPRPSAATTAATTAKMVMNASQIQRNKLQNVPAFLNKLYK
jgi:hypothetical protein